MANDNLSSVAVQIFSNKLFRKEHIPKVTFLIDLFSCQKLSAQSVICLRKFRYMKKNMMAMGFALSCLGDNNQYSIISSRNGDELSDIALKFSFDG